MKIIDEIEKSRLSDNEMNAVTGGLAYTLTIAENCSETQKYSYCSMKFEITECYTKLSCPSTYYWACTGPSVSQYQECSPHAIIIKR